MSPITINPRERIAIIGSGGKTTLMCNLARSCVGRVIMTTTTHLAAPADSEGYLPDALSNPRQPGAPIALKYPGVFAPFTGLDDLAQRWQQGEPCLLTARLDNDQLYHTASLGEHHTASLGEHHTARTSDSPSHRTNAFNKSCQRLLGLNPDEVDAICAWPDLERLVVEADGSKRLPIKAHMSDEPVLFSKCTLGIAVIGLRALKRRVVEGEVHRAPLLRQLLGCNEEHRLTPEDLARAAQAYLAQLDTPRRALVLSQVEHGSENELKSVLQALHNMLSREYAGCELAVQMRGELIGRLASQP